MTRAALKTAPKVDRVPNRPTLAASPTAAMPTGGMFGAGIIPHVSLCTRGEALGHGFWVDQVMIQQIAELASQGQRLKCRFTHPDLCSDGTGKALGRLTDFSSTDDQVFGDLNFFAQAHDAPDGDLAGYVIGLANEDPEAFGLSIVFSHDWEAEDEFEAEHTQEVELKDESGEVVDVVERFVSPDPDNVENLRHARVAALYAADVVDDPAANPNGLFHREAALATEGRGILDFILGRSKSVPALSALSDDIAPERLKAFVDRYLADNGLTLFEEGETPMLNLFRKKAKPALTKKTATSKPTKIKPALKSKAAKDDDQDEDDDDDGPDNEDSDTDDDENEGGEQKKAPPKKGEKCDVDDDDEDGATNDPDDDPDDDGDADDNDDGDAVQDNEDDTDPDPNEGEDPDDDENEGMRAKLSQYCEYFGNERGAQYFLAKKSFTSALKAEVKHLRKQLSAANQKLEAFAHAGIDPLKFNASPAEQKAAGLNAGNAANGGGMSNREKFAELNKETQQLPKEPKLKK